MTRERAISEVEQIYGMLSPDKQQALDVLINSVKVDMMYDLAKENAGEFVQKRTGHWIDHQMYRWIYAKCSECETVHDTQTNFCPNCGADMRGEQE